MKNQNFRMYKGVKIEYLFNGIKREYQTTFANIGHYGTLKQIKNIINKELKLYK